MTEPPKLFTNKPNRAALLKNLVDQQKQQQHSSPPPPPPTESFARRYRFLWPLLLALNLGVGVYLFARTKKKDTAHMENLDVEETHTPVPTPTSNTAVVTDVTTSSIVKTPKAREQVPENQQRELFKWLLEEKRKIRPKDAEEKKRLDEEKAILKHFIRAKSIPRI